MSSKSTGKTSEKEDKNEASGGGLTDFKLTIITSAIFLGVIAYLLKEKAAIEPPKIYTDCSDYFRAGFREDGVYELTPVRSDLEKRFDVYCNMTKGGWTVIMKREAKNKNVNFEQDLKQYKRGFGSLMTDHWLGLDYISLLTTTRQRQMMAIINATEYKVANFQVLNEYYHYKIVMEDDIDKYIDGSSFLRMNNSYFSTRDVDFDLAQNSSCSAGWKAGWWFTDCFDHSICMPCLIMHGDAGTKQLSKAVMLIK